jgi:hypothetical protein
MAKLSEQEQIQALEAKLKQLKALQQRREARGAMNSGARFWWGR